MFKECPVQRIEVITGEQKRRRYTPEEKARFVALAMQPATPSYSLPGNMASHPVFFLSGNGS